MVRFDRAAEILPGIAALATPAHTRGNMSFQVYTGGRSTLIARDAIGNHHIAFQRRMLIIGADQDGAVAAQSRKMLFDCITSEDLVIVGFHPPAGGLSRVDRSGGGFVFVPGAR